MINAGCVIELRESFEIAAGSPYAVWEFKM